MSNMVIRSDVTGTVWKLEVREGDEVGEDQPLVVLESMKMEIPCVAPRAATVRSILVREGEPVREGQDLVVLELH